MTAITIGLLSILVIILLIYSGMHIAVALTLTSFMGVWIIRGKFSVASKMMSLAMTETLSAYVFGVIPLFVLMGLVVSKAGIGRDAFIAANRVFGRVTAGVGVATVAANAIFAAITGISIASAAVFTKIAVPEMLRLGYLPRFAVGIVAGSSILGMLIPPSLLLIVFAVLSEQSVGDMFIAGILPGLLMAVVFALGVILMATLRPGIAGQHQTETDQDPRGTLRLLAPTAGLVIIVLGGIYAGFFTPTEAGAIGAVMALFIAIFKRALTGTDFWNVLREVGQVTASICLLIVGATMYTRMLTLSGVPGTIGDWFNGAGLGYWQALLIYLALLIVMGTILDSMSILLIMVPLAMPIFVALDADPVWFGLITIVAVEIGIITPPLGIAVFVIKDSLDDQSISLWDVFAGAFPFVLMMTFVLALLVAFPMIVTGLL